MNNYTTRSIIIIDKDNSNSSAEQEGEITMRASYVIANGQPNDRAIYYTGEQDFHGGELWGNIHEAYRFESKEDVIARVLKEDWTASPIIVEIYDCTWKIIEQGYKDLRAGEMSSDREVYHRYNTVSYITNSQIIERRA